MAAICKGLGSTAELSPVGYLKESKTQKNYWIETYPHSFALALEEYWPKSLTYLFSVFVFKGVAALDRVDALFLMEYVASHLKFFPMK